jgi:hypothetical protein
LGLRPVSFDRFRADDETRTRDPHLGKVMRYQLRYIRIPQGISVAFSRSPRDHLVFRFPSSALQGETLAEGVHMDQIGVPVCYFPDTRTTSDQPRSLAIK